MVCHRSTRCAPARRRARRPVHSTRALPPRTAPAAKHISSQARDRIAPLTLHPRVAFFIAVRAAQQKDFSQYAEEVEKQNWRRERYTATRMGLCMMRMMAATGLSHLDRVTVPRQVRVTV